MFNDYVYIILYKELITMFIDFGSSKLAKCHILVLSTGYIMLIDF